MILNKTIKNEEDCSYVNYQRRIQSESIEP
jgi:hypothetical protein